MTNKKSFLDDFVDAANGIKEFDILRNPKPVIKYKGVEVVTISRCLLDDNAQMLAEKLDCPCQPPKHSKTIEETNSYLFTLKDGQKFELNKMIVKNSH